MSRMVLKCTVGSKRFLASPKLPDPFWGPPSHLLNACRGYFVGVKRLGIYTFLLLRDLLFLTEAFLPVHRIRNLYGTKCSIKLVHKIFQHYSQSVICTRKEVINTF